MNRVPIVDRASIAYRAAGWAVAATELGIEIAYLTIEKTDSVNYEATMKFTPSSRPARPEEAEVMCICGTWAEATLRYDKRHQDVRAALLGLFISPLLDRDFILERSEFISLNHAENIALIASSLLAGKTFVSHELKGLVRKRSVGESKPN